MTLSDRPALQVLLACDRGPGVGLGHLGRMRALAAAFAARGLEAELTDAGLGARRPIVVVDSYRWRADDRSRFGGDLVVAIDDLDRDLVVDLVVDPFPAPVGLGSASPRAGAVLAGPGYALLDGRLVAMAARPVGTDVDRVLVTGGGADETGWSAGVARHLRAALPPATVVALVEGPWSAGQSPPGVEAVRTTDGLGSELARADLVVTAAGVTMLEALALGRPTVASALVDNQRRQAEAARSSGAAVVVDGRGAAASAVELATDARRRMSLSAAARALVDGLGAARVVDAVCSLRCCPGAL